MRKVLFVLAIAGAGCAQPEQQPGATSDPDVILDEDGEPIPQPTECSATEHLCNDTCTSALPDDPENGCANGCGDACVPPPNSVAVCTAGACDFTCVEPFVRVGGECVFAQCADAGYQCGELVVGADTLDCGSCDTAGTCVDHQCQVAADAKEANNTALTSTKLSTVTDDHVMRKATHLTLHSSSDEDWFQFWYEDTYNFLGDFAAIAIILTGEGDSPFYPSYVARTEITVWFKCDTEDNGTLVASRPFGGSTDELVDPTFGVGSTYVGDLLPGMEVRPACTSLDDSGWVTVRVRMATDAPAPRGEVYDLHYWGTSY